MNNFIETDNIIPTRYVLYQRPAGKGRRFSNFKTIHKAVWSKYP